MKLQQEGITTGDRLKPNHPPKPLKTLSTREAGLVSEIESQIDSDKQWIFKLNREHWREHLPNGWSTSDPLHPALETLLHSTTLPLWAAGPPLAKEWAVLQEAW